MEEISRAMALPCSRAVLFGLSFVLCCSRVAQSVFHDGQGAGGARQVQGAQEAVSQRSARHAVWNGEEWSGVVVMRCWLTHFRFSACLFGCVRQREACCGEALQPGGGQRRCRHGIVQARLKAHQAMRLPIAFAPHSLSTPPFLPTLFDHASSLPRRRRPGRSTVRDPLPSAAPPLCRPLHVQPTSRFSFKQKLHTISDASREKNKNSPRSSLAAFRRALQLF